LLYITLTASGASSTITGAAGSFTLSSAPTQSVYLAYWTGTEWDNVSDTAATVSGTAVSFTYFPFATAVQANPSAYFALYETGSSPLPVASPSPSASASASASASPSPSGNFVDTACLQTPAPTQPVSTLTSVASTFFTTIIPNGHTICLSAWDLSGNVTSALVTAAHNGHSVTVITPYSENSSNSSDLAQIIAAGGHVKTEYTSASGKGTASSTTEYQLSSMDIHAKFALIDGVAYMDGHNWFNTDVIVQDPFAGDFNAIQQDLATFATPAPTSTAVPGENFTTDKQVSLQTETTYLQQVAIPAINAGTVAEYDFMTETFNPNNSSGDYNDDVYAGMCAIAASPTHPTIHVVVEDYSGYSSSAQSALQNLELLDPNASVRTESSGLEKISMIRTTAGATSPASGWFGSSNATTTDLFDWGIDLSNTSNSGVLTALASYFDSTYASSNAISTPTGAPAPCPSIHP
jgi:hypothetical protein